MRQTLRGITYRLFQPIDGASIAVFRMLFGGIMLWEVWRYFSHGWIERWEQQERSEAATLAEVGEPTLTITKAAERFGCDSLDRI
jgi:hypothetical protein